MIAKYIVIEGAGGSGKTTIAKEVYDCIKENFCDTVISTKEPGSELINKEHQIFRNLLLYDSKIKADPHLQILGFMMDRIMHMEKVYEKLNEGHTIISDRNYISNMIYQGMEGKIGLEKCYDLHLSFCPLSVQQPDLFILLDVPASIIAERLNQRLLNHNYNKVNIETIQKRKQTYLDVTKKYIDNDKLIIIDTSKPIIENKIYLKERIAKLWT